MVAQANEANTATDETPAKAAPLRARRLAFCSAHRAGDDVATAGHGRSAALPDRHQPDPVDPGHWRGPVGRDVAEDPCWQLPEEKRKNLSEAEKVSRCTCLGPNLFTRCEFPGIQAKYDPAVDAPEPVKPQDPGDPPPQPPRPEPPKDQSPEAQSRYQDEMQRYEEAMRQYQQDIETYQDKVKQFRSAMDTWQTDYGEWKEKRNSAIGDAEGLIRKFHEDYGNTFNVNLVRRWGALGLIMVVMFGLLVLVQKRKDVV